MSRRPVVAIVGRPNVGKSTLVNRLVGQRIAVVEDVPGVTRDRVTHAATWAGRDFTLVDTGGWEPRATGLAGAVAAQAEVAVAEADAVLLVVDATVGATAEDRAAASVVQRSGRPALLVANKADDAASELEAAELWSLGLGEPLPVSALHGRGSGDLLDRVVALLPDAAREADDEPDGPRRVALVGRPNVGKSSLLNKLLGRERVLVDAAAGTTRDPVDAEVQIAGSTYLFVDTAGLRRRTKEAAGAEYYASLRTHTALQRAEVAALVLDASQPLTEQDQRIASMVTEAGRALVLLLNKWDLVDEDRRHDLERELTAELSPIGWAPRVNVSARTGRALEKLPRALDAALEGWDTRVPTGRLNAWLGEVIAATPPPARGGRAPRVRFATQADVRPPRFVLFSSGFLEETYRRFLTRRLREDFGFVGTPIELSVRLRER